MLTQTVALITPIALVPSFITLPQSDKFLLSLNDDTSAGEARCWLYSF